MMESTTWHILSSSGIIILKYNKQTKLLSNFSNDLIVTEYKSIANIKRIEQTDMYYLIGRNYGAFPNDMIRFFKLTSDYSNLVLHPQNILYYDNKLNPNSAHLDFNPLLQILAVVGHLEVHFYRVTAENLCPGQILGIYCSTCHSPYRFFDCDSCFPGYALKNKAPGQYYCKLVCPNGKYDGIGYLGYPECMDCPPNLGVGVVCDRDFDDKIKIIGCLGSFTLSTDGAVCTNNCQITQYYDINYVC